MKTKEDLIEIYGNGISNLLEINPHLNNEAIFTLEELNNLHDTSSTKLELFIKSPYIPEELISYGFTYQDLITISLDKMSALHENPTMTGNLLLDHGFSVANLLNMEYKTIEFLYKNIMITKKLHAYGFTNDQISNIDFEKLQLIYGAFKSSEITIFDQFIQMINPINATNILFTLQDNEISSCIENVTNIGIESIIELLNTIQITQLIYNLVSATHIVEPVADVVVEEPVVYSDNNLEFQQVVEVTKKMIKEQQTSHNVDINSADNTKNIVTAPVIPAIKESEDEEQKSDGKEQNSEKKVTASYGGIILNKVTTNEKIIKETNNVNYLGHIHKNANPNDVIKQQQSNTLEEFTRSLDALNLPDNKYNLLLKNFTKINIILKDISLEKLSEFSFLKLTNIVNSGKLPQQNNAVVNIAKADEIGKDTKPVFGDRAKLKTVEIWGDGLKNKVVTKEASSISGIKTAFLEKLGTQKVNHNKSIFSNENTVSENTDVAKFQAVTSLLEDSLNKNLGGNIQDM
jgi:hypothetical protein